MLQLLLFLGELLALRFQAVDLPLGRALPRQRLAGQVLPALPEGGLGLVVEVVHECWSWVSCSSICLREAAMSTRARRILVICSSIWLYE